MLGYDNHVKRIPCGRAGNGLLTGDKYSEWPNEVWNLDFQSREQVQNQDGETKQRYIETASVASVPTDAESVLLADESYQWDLKRIHLLHHKETTGSSDTKSHTTRRGSTCVA